MDIACAGKDGTLSVDTIACAACASLAQKDRGGNCAEDNCDDAAGIYENEQNMESGDMGDGPGRGWCAKSDKRMAISRGHETPTSSFFKKRIYRIPFGRMITFAAFYSTISL
jgi:hypothetical protein